MEKVMSMKIQNKPTKNNTLKNNILHGLKVIKTKKL